MKELLEADDGYNKTNVNNLQIIDEIQYINDFHQTNTMT